MGERHKDRVASGKAEDQRSGVVRLWNICVGTRWYGLERLFVIPKTNKEV